MAEYQVDGAVVLTFDVSVSDLEESATATVSITLVDVNEEPSFVNQPGVEAAENLEPNTVLISDLQVFLTVLVFPSEIVLTVLTFLTDIVLTVLIFPTEIFLLFCYFLLKSFLLFWYFLLKSFLLF
jgi:hypothetical protein